METATAYYTRRARQERQTAYRATSAVARRAHLELAHRLVNVATDPVPWGVKQIDDAPGTTDRNDDAMARKSEVASVLSKAFSLPDSGAFGDLLQAIDVREKPLA